MSNTISWTEIFSSLTNKTELTSAQSMWAMNTVMDGKATNDEIKQFLLGLKEKGESPAEITSFVEVMLEHAVKLDVSNDAVDTCGTGGDSLGTVNISTAAALVVAGCGIPVVKHGNRAASSKSGSADVLEALGVLTSMNPEQVKESFQKCGITFCFAPTFHPAMKHVGPVRKELGIPTVFNILGPLANPANCDVLLIRMSISLVAFEPSSSPKKFSALFPVKPIVKRFIQIPSNLQLRQVVRNQVFL